MITVPYDNSLTAKDAKDAKEHLRIAYIRNAKVTIRYKMPYGSMRKNHFPLVFFGVLRVLRGSRCQASAFCLDFVGFLEHALDTGLVLALMAFQQLERIQAPGEQHPQPDVAQRPGLLDAGDQPVLEIEPERELEFIDAPG